MPNYFTLDAIDCGVAKHTLEFLWNLLYLYDKMSYEVAADPLEFFLALDNNDVSIVGEDGIPSNGIIENFLLDSGYVSIEVDVVFDFDVSINQVE